MSEIAHFYLTQSYAQAGGTNVVNVILVDFRAVDTWGEMTVLGATALTIAALLLNRRPTPPQPSAVDMRSPLAHVRENLVHIRVFGRVFGVLIILLSAFLLLRGHYEPGGGFIAALVAGAGYALLYLAADSDTDRRLRWPYLAFIGGGIAAYKACHLIRNFTERGDSVRVIPTENALRFVGAATFEALSGNPVDTSVFTRVDEVQHVRLGQEADLEDAHGAVL